MSDAWIVSDYNFHQHKSLTRAEREMARLVENHPDKTFRVYRIKHSLRKSGSKQIISNQQDRIAKLERLLGMATVALLPLKGDDPAVVAAQKAIQEELRKAQRREAAARPEGEGA